LISIHAFKIRARIFQHLWTIHNIADFEVSGETHLLSTEVAGGFTGIFIAMYAYSAAETVTPAAFDWFEYEPAREKQ